MQNSLYKLVETRFASQRPTWSLILTQSGWDKVKDLFDERGYGINKYDVDIPHKSTLWTLQATLPFVSINPETNEESFRVRIYGHSGDFSFGGAPHRQNRLSGNKRAAKYVYNEFIKKHLTA